MTPKYEAIAIVEFRNCAPFVYRIKSDSPITIDVLAKHFQEHEDWNEDRDSITIVETSTTAGAEGGGCRLTEITI